ncbi:MAG: glycoside hydrolase family 2 [candidate division KSB1 bacterium]|nr:glycoside hydrolase family 2 [candidate division KSB1 bacterium]
MHRWYKTACWIVSLLSLSLAAVPLPEHPRPDFERAEWLNLNGEWQFEFDPENKGLTESWQTGGRTFSESILVPFPWGSPLSGIKDEAPIGWYRRTLFVPPSWQGKRVFLVVGASDWETTAWLDGQQVGAHRGGYTPFEFELTSLVKWGSEQTLTLRVDDTEHAFKLFGKQGYGNARGIWQTVYLEARPTSFIRSVRFLPDIDRSLVTVQVTLNEKSPFDGIIELRFKNGEQEPYRRFFPQNSQTVEFSLPIESLRLWSLEDPFLYEVEVVLSIGEQLDRVSSYFGMRKISVVPFPGQSFTYIALNNKPIYLQLTLDQAYHPEGYYTFPSDEFMREEILRTRRLGLNGQRVHVKVEIPRKLYWADKLGVLIMADVPNSWGEPDEEMRREFLTALEGMIERDFNHPSIFAWVLFNETWGLFSGKGEARSYRKETQDWVEQMYRYAKKLDPTRLVEDNSPCNYDHVETDINSWHAYLPGYKWREFLSDVSAKTFRRSRWNFVKGKSQGSQPNINSECGNVWGYKGSTGDVDWSWDYHRMLNEFRRFPKIAGWLYTEHHDVINEWNGYYRYDRSLKYTGFEELFPGMRLNDLHSAFYISTGQDICRAAEPGETVSVPLYASFLTDAPVGDTLQLEARLYGWDDLGMMQDFSRQTLPILYRPWTSKELEPLLVEMPKTACVALLGLTLSSRTGQVLQRNFSAFVVSEGSAPRLEEREREGKRLIILRQSPKAFSDAQWSVKQWQVLDGLKVNGAGSGFFEYRFPWPSSLPLAQTASASFHVEASAKQLFGKDRENAVLEGDYMRGGGAHDPGANPNAYPMSDEKTYPSAVRIFFNGIPAGVFDLPDDPADSRGILSWFSQPTDGTLHEAGSYGYHVAATIPAAALRSAAESGELIVRLQVDEALPHGLAIYGERFGRYLFDPMVVIERK